MVDRFDDWMTKIDECCYVCYDCVMFKTYTNDKDKKVLLGDAHTTNVVDIADMKLKFTFGKNLILKDVMCAPEIINNLF